MFDETWRSPNRIMTPSLINAYVKTIVRETDPPWEIRRLGVYGRVGIHFLGILSVLTRARLTDWLDENMPLAVVWEVTDEGCHEHEDCRATPELSRACWLDARAKAEGEA